MPNVTKAAIATILRKAVRDCITWEDHIPSSIHAATYSPTSNQASEHHRSDPPQQSPETLFFSPKAEKVKDEIVQAGRKLWQRAYVDGNGGNISARISNDYVLCTPTLCSKGDMQSGDLSLVDLDNRQLCGDRAQTSEILLHLAIYREVPSAHAVIHCHPPYATAFALTGSAPQANLTPEQAIFIGPVVMAPYETPGTLDFARTVLPFVQDHNTILLSNHGVVCWADTVTHARWYVEVVENYCKTLAIASQFGLPIQQIPASKIDDLMAVKRRLGLPDPRLREAAGATDGIAGGVDAVPAEKQEFAAGPDSEFSVEEIEALVASMTDQVMTFFNTAP